jgi:Holliday junction resolvase RusA-like endonuclease
MSTDSVGSAEEKPPTYTTNVGNLDLYSLTLSTLCRSVETAITGSTITQKKLENSVSSAKKANGTHKANHRRRSSSPKSEQDVWDESLAAKAREKRYPGRISVIITSNRKRLLDQDNLCVKYFLDCLRYAGVIPDDNPQAIDLQIRQIKVSKGQKEFTRIEVG